MRSSSLLVYEIEGVLGIRDQRLPSECLPRGPTYSLYVQRSPRATHRRHVGCPVSHFTFLRRHGSHEKALF